VISNDKAKDVLDKRRVALRGRGGLGKPVRRYGIYLYKRPRVNHAVTVLIRDNLCSMRKTAALGAEGSGATWRPLVSARKVSPGLARTRMTRRGVLTVGGLTLVTGYLLGPAKQSASSASTHDARATSTHPASPALASPRVASTEPSVASEKSTGKSPMYYVNDGPKGIALTIDDGPSPVYTPQVLAILEQYQVTATFSMIGLEVDAHPGVAREVVAAGHVIANHTWSHIDLARLKAAAVADQLDQATDAIHKATGTVPDLFRAPYGAWSATVLRQCAKTGMTPVDWSVDPRDWARPGVNSIVRNIMRNTETGSIILEHDGGGNRSETVAALKIVIPRLLDAGYRFYAL